MKPITKVLLYTFASVISCFVMFILSAEVLSEFRVYSNTVLTLTSIITSLIPAGFFSYRAWVAGKPIREEREMLRAMAEQAKEQGDDMQLNESTEYSPVCDLIGIFVLPIFIALSYKSSVRTCIVSTILWLFAFVRLITWLISYAKQRNKNSHKQ